jgi:DNA-binding transcriptional ArsR family regulator
MFDMKANQHSDSLQQLQASAAQACALLKTMAHVDRLVLMCRLAQGEYCVGELEQDLGIRQPTLSQQLGVLRQEGLVDTRREGKHVYYRLTSEDASAVMEVLHRRLCAPVATMARPRRSECAR